MIHIEGMGIPGCLLARKLHEHGVEFTWSDNDTFRNAWMASTGAIYPSGSTKFGPDEECREVWRQWHEAGAFGRATEKGRWVFNSKKPPHQGRFPQLRFGSLGVLSGQHSFHLNSQLMVSETRRLFEKKRLQTNLPLCHSTRIVSHGFGRRLGYAYWGWSCYVQLEYHGLQLTRDVQPRPAFYFREGLLNMSYAYPTPGTVLWYAGSSLVRQQKDKLKSLDAEKHYRRWKANFERMGDGKVRVTYEGEITEGWRPAADPSDVDWLRVDGNTIELRPLWNSGIRHFPKQWSLLAAELGIQIPDWEKIT